VPTQYPVAKKKIKTLPTEKKGLKGNKETFPHNPIGDVDILKERLSKN
jgi:hypothetical protein